MQIKSFNPNFGSGPNIGGWSLVTTEYKQKQWENALGGMADNFTSQEWLNKVECELNMSKETAYGWLRELQTNHMIEKIKHGEYHKTGMEIINEE